MTTGSPPSVRANAIRWYAPGISRSSSSACATAVRKSTSQSVGASCAYASPRARLRRNARWLARWLTGPIVVYVCAQSTESPSVRHSCSNAFSSSSVSRRHSSTKLRREMLTGSLAGLSGAV